MIAVRYLVFGLLAAAVVRGDEGMVRNLWNQWFSVYMYIHFKTFKDDTEALQ